MLLGFGMGGTSLALIQEKIRPCQREARDLDLMLICLVQFATLSSTENSQRVLGT